MLNDLAAHVMGMAFGAVDASGDPKLPVAAATEDNVEVDGPILDGMGIPNGTVALFLYTLAKLTEAKTLTATVKLYHGDESDLSDEALVATLLDGEVIATGDTGGSTEGDLTVVPLTDPVWQGCKRYRQFKVTVDLSHTGTDTANWALFGALGGQPILPATIPANVAS